MSNGALVQGQAIEAIPVAERHAPEVRHLQLVVPRLNRHENAGVYAIAAVRWNAIFEKAMCSQDTPAYQVLKRHNLLNTSYRLDR